jgi:hypothetical protein
VLAPTCPPCPHASAEGFLDPIKTTASTGVTFKLVLDSSSPDEAEEFCKSCCGHLAAYTSRQEQFDVENFYVSGGVMPEGGAWHRAASRSLTLLRACVLSVLWCGGCTDSLQCVVELCGCHAMAPGFMLLHGLPSGRPWPEPASPAGAAQLSCQLTCLPSCGAPQAATCCLAFPSTPSTGWAWSPTTGQSLAGWTSQCLRLRPPRTTTGAGQTAEAGSPSR